MGDRGIELVAHPVAELAVLEQRDGVFDEIVEVEQRAGALLALVALRNGADDIEQRVGALDQLGAAQLANEAIEPLRLALGQIGEGRIELAHLLADQVLGQRAIGVEEGIEQVARRWIDRVERAELPLQRLAGAGGEQVADLARSHQPLADHRGLDLLARAARADESEQVGLRQVAIAEDRPQLSRLAERRADRLVELAVGEQLEQRTRRRPRPSGRR